MKNFFMVICLIHMVVLMVLKIYIVRRKIDIILMSVKLLNMNRISVEQNINDIWWEQIYHDCFVVVLKQKVNYDFDIRGQENILVVLNQKFL